MLNVLLNTRVVPVNRGLVLLNEIVYWEFNEICMICLYTSKHFFYKYGRNHSLDNNVMNLYLRVSLRMRSKSQIILLHFL